MEEAIISIDHAGYRPHYLHDIKVCVRKFYEWLRQTDDYPQEVAMVVRVVEVVEDDVEAAAGMIGPQPPESLA